MEDMFIDWSNSLRLHEQGERFVASQTADTLKREGYSAAEALDLLAADNFDLRIAEQAVAVAYEVAQDEVAPTPVREAQLVPTEYADVREQVEATLSQVSPRDFIKLLTASEAPLLRVSQRNIESLTRLAHNAKTGDAAALAQLHRDLKPWLEDAMLRAVCASEQKVGTMRVASLDRGGSGDNTYMVGNCQVSLRTAKCNCASYLKGNYASFGLACEHLVTAMDAVSPEVRLMRAVKED